MDSQVLLEKLNLSPKPPGQLFDDPDQVLRATLFRSTDDPQLDREAIIHWWMHVYNPGSPRCDDTTLKVYQSWDRAQWPLFKYVRTGSGYFPEANQQTVRITMYKKDPVEPAIEELRLWLPHIKRIPFSPRCRHSDEKGQPLAAYIDIFESTLSQHGCYDLWYISDDDIRLTFTYSDPVKFKNLFDAVDYIREHHWYEKKRT